VDVNVEDRLMVIGPADIKWVNLNIVAYISRVDLERGSFGRPCSAIGNSEMKCNQIKKTAKRNDKPTEIALGFSLIDRDCDHSFAIGNYPTTHVMITIVLFDGSHNHKLLSQFGKSWVVALLF
jgi:hypothetical protein